MKYEPKKELRDIDVLCFSQVEADGVRNVPVIENTKCFVSGTDEGFAACGLFFQNQLEMCEQYGTATRTLYFRTPDQFTVPYIIKPKDIYPLKGLSFINKITVKVDKDAARSQLTRQGLDLSLVTTVDDLKETVFQCAEGRCTRGYAATFLGDYREIDADYLTCVYLGDWLAAD